MVRLDVTQRRRWPAVTYDRAFAIFLAVAEPLEQHLLAGDFIEPHFRLNSFNISLPNQQPLLAGIVIDRIRHHFGVFGYLPCCRNARCFRGRQPWRLSGPPFLWVCHTLAEGMQPDYFLS